MTIESEAIRYHGSYGGAIPPTSGKALPFSVDIVHQLLLEDQARELAAQVDQIRMFVEWERWMEAHSCSLIASYSMLPDCPAIRRLTQARQTAKTEFARVPS